MTTTTIEKTVKARPAGASTLPPKAPREQEILDLIQDQVFQLVMDEFHDRKSLIVQENHLTISTISEMGETIGRITREPDGTIRFHHHCGKMISLLNDPTLGRDLPGQIQEEVKRAVKRYTQLLTEGTAGEEDPLASEQIRKAMAKCANAASITLKCHPIRRAAAKNHGILHEFLGTGNVSRTLKLAGRTARLKAHAIIMRNPGLFEEASRINPNATCMWLTLEEPPDLVKMPSGPMDLVRDFQRRFVSEIRQSLCEIRIQAMLDSHNEDPEAIPIRQTWLEPPGPEIDAPEIHDPETPEERDLWEIFCRLNPKAVRDNTLVTRQMVRVCRTIQEAGVQPSYTALRAISQTTKRYLSNSDIDIAMIRESRRLADRKQSGQKILNRQYCEAVKKYDRQYPTPRNHQDWQENPPDWQEILRFWKIGEDQTGDMPTGKTTSKTTGKTTGKKRTSRTPPPPRPHQIQQVLEDGAGRLIQDIIRDAAMLEIQPGRLVGLKTRNPHTKEIRIEQLRMERTPGGALRSNHPLWGHGKTLPDPAENTEMPGWGSMGTWKLVTRETAAPWLIQNWKQLGSHITPRPPTENRAATAISHWLRKNGMPGDQELSRELLQGIRSLIDPETHRLAAQLNSGKVTINSYNIARAGLRNLEQLSETNPGITAWAIAHGSPREEINHPGQIITMAKEEFLNHGLEPGAWRTAAAISREDMQAISRNRSTQALVDLINILARTGIKPRHPVLQHIDRKLGQMTPNMMLAAELFIREHGGETGNKRNDYQIRQEFQNIRDYAAHMDARGETLRSRSLAGLKTRSERWHRELRELREKNEWEMTISRQGYRYSAWNSLIGETSIGETSIGETSTPAMTAVPLVTQKELHEESIRMGHCVRTYAEYCRTGRSRIFSILRDGENIATGEIREQNGSWESIQVQGRNNRPPEPGAETAMAQIAREYTKSWRDNPHHRDWTIPVKGELQS